MHHHHHQTPPIPPSRTTLKVGDRRACGTFPGNQPRRPHHEDCPVHSQVTKAADYIVITSPHYPCALQRPTLNGSLHPRLTSRYPSPPIHRQPLFSPYPPRFPSPICSLTLRRRCKPSLSSPPRLHRFFDQGPKFHLPLIQNQNPNQNLNQ